MTFRPRSAVSRGCARTLTGGAGGRHSLLGESCADLIETVRRHAHGSEQLQVLCFELVRAHDVPPQLLCALGETVRSCWSARIAHGAHGVSCGHIRSR